MHYKLLWKTKRFQHYTYLKTNVRRLKWAKNGLKKSVMDRFINSIMAKNIHTISVTGCISAGKTTSMKEVMKILESKYGKNGAFGNSVDDIECSDDPKMYHIPSEANESQIEGGSILFFVPEVATDRVISKLLVNDNSYIDELAQLHV